VPSNEKPEKEEGRISFHVSRQPHREAHTKYKLTNIVRLQITVKDHASRDGVFVAVGHGLSDRPSNTQHIQERKVLPSPESPTTIANTGIVSQHLGQSSSVKSFQHHKAYSLACRTSTNETDDIVMV
jgi:hypothetical protein